MPVALRPPTPNSALPRPPPLHADMPLMVVINAASGREGGDMAEAVRSHLHEARQPHELHVARRARELPEAARRAAESALSRGGALVAVGGDGSINTVATQAWHAGLALGVIPQGTFNYFARANAVPTALEAALRHLLDGVRFGRLRPVQLGRLNEALFLVNASVGLYPQLLQDREAQKQRWGRSRLVAAWAALGTVLSGHRDLRLRLDTSAHPTLVVRTPTLFVGNNALQMDQVGLPEAPAVGQGVLSAVALEPLGRWGLLKLAALGALGRLGQAQTVRHAAVTSLTASPVGMAAGRRGARAMRVAIDGETRWMAPPLHFEVAPRPLWLLGVALRPPQVEP